MPPEGALIHQQAFLFGIFLPHRPPSFSVFSRLLPLVVVVGGGGEGGIPQHKPAIGVCAACMDLVF